MPKLAVVIVDTEGAALAAQLPAQCVIAYPDTVEAAHFAVPAKLRPVHRAALCIGLLEILSQLGWTVAVLGSDEYTRQLASLQRIEVLP